MTRTMLPNFATLSEFIAGLNGDCGPTATLSALNFVDPKRWPLDAAGLHALDNDEIAGGFAESNGAQNVNSIDSYLNKIKVAHTTVGYNVFTFAQLHADLKSKAGIKPIIVEWALAGALPGDEAGVHFHYSTCGGLDTGPKGDGVGGGYLWCDGDNRMDDPNGAPRPPVMYTIQQVAAAQPCGYVIIDQASVNAPPVPAPVDWQKKYTDLKAALNAALGAN
jgi:hypothetical protein